MTHPTQNLEAAIVAAGANVAPRITPADVEANIVGAYYFNGEDAARGAVDSGVIDSGDADALRLLTFCVLVLRNGFTVTGQSACASPENFNGQIGRRIARENAVAAIWPFMGYELRSKLASA